MSDPSDNPESNQERNGEEEEKEEKKEQVDVEKVDEEEEDDEAKRVEKQEQQRIQEEKNKKEKEAARRRAENTPMAFRKLKKPVISKPGGSKTSYESFSRMGHYPKERDPNEEREEIPPVPKPPPTGDEPGTSDRFKEAEFDPFGLPPIIAKEKEKQRIEEMMRNQKQIEEARAQILSERNILKKGFDYVSDKIDNMGPKKKKTPEEMDIGSTSHSGETSVITLSPRNDERVVEDGGSGTETISNQDRNGARQEENVADAPPEPEIQNDNTQVDPVVENQRGQDDQNAANNSCFDSCVLL
ncbi:hypothetical protein CRE_05523 [Caenorhabditis remanei]|uniref:Uncharacterized protein n=1 Tax=Caenorhabditis remanei TaxID=31234 RepID=E3LZR9_CAERE|nr:hypothetical protein CRE_05523 [Caenorhabditis remanei]